MKLSRFAHEAVLAVLIVVVMLVAWRLDPKFVALETQRELIGLVWEPALIALAMTLVVLTAGIDLSVGATMSLAAVAFGLAYERGQSMGACAAVALAVGALCGLANGAVVTRMRVHPLIVTLGTLAAFYGLAEGISQARPVSGFMNGFEPSPSLPAVAVLVMSVAVAVFLAKTVAGRSIYAIGLNERAARFSGLRVDRIKLALYAFCGLMSAMAAVFYALRRNTVKADVGLGMELDAITAVVLGGTVITGGRGGIVGTLLGLLLLHEVQQFVTWHWEREELNLIVVGSVLIAAVLLNSLLARAPKSSK